MNAPSFANLKNIEMFRDILADDFIEETLARQKKIQKSKIDAILISR